MSNLDDKLQASAMRGAKKTGRGLKSFGRAVGNGLASYGDHLAEQREQERQRQERERQAPWHHQDKPRKCSVHTHLYDCEDRDCFWHRSAKAAWYAEHES